MASQRISRSKWSSSSSSRRSRCDPNRFASAAAGRSILLAVFVAQMLVLSAAESSAEETTHVILQWDKSQVANLDLRLSFNFERHSRVSMSHDDTEVATINDAKQQEALEVS